MGATARMQYCDLRVNHSFSDFEDQAGRIGVLYGNEVCSESARHGAAKQSLQLCVCGLEIFRNELTSSRSLRAAALMSIPDANRLSGSPVLRSPEQEIALSAVICTHNRYDLLPEAIESLVKQDVPADLFEIIVVDNSPNQAAAARFGQRYSDLSNLGQGTAPRSCRI